MKFAPPAIALFLFVDLALAPSLLSAPLERSVSPSRQFILYGLTLPLRGAMGALAEKTKSSLLAILQKRDQWKTPIILNLQPAQANVPDIPAAQLHVSQTGMGLKIQLDLTIAAKVDTQAIQRELLRALLVELIYRERPDVPAGTMYAEAPPWLIEGVLAWNSSNPKQTLNSLLTRRRSRIRLFRSMFFSSKNQSNSMRREDWFIALTRPLCSSSCLISQVVLRDCPRSSRICRTGRTIRSST